MQRTAGDRELSFFVEGRKASREDALGHPITVVGDDLPEGPSVHAFGSDDTFRGWAARTKAARHFDHVAATIDRVKGQRNEDHARAKRLALSRQRWVQEELDRLQEETGLDRTSPEFWRRAMVDPPGLEGPILHTAIPTENSDGTGSSVFLLSALPLPDFGWFGFNDKASGLFFTGAGVLTENPWYGGRSFWFFGIHLWLPPLQLSFVAFDNIASAGYCIGP